MLWGLVKRRTCVLPTWRGSLALLFVAGTLVFGVGRHAHSFLAQVEPVLGGILVVEGWAPDYAMAQTAAEFKRHAYTRLYVTGGPLEAGTPLAEYKTYAQRGAAILLKMGLATNEIEAVPAEAVRQDRTYAAAMALSVYLREHGGIPERVHLITEGPHARRSRLLLQMALGKEARVGVTAIPVHDYDPDRWWQSSAGVRGVVGEAIAYTYARFLFRP